MKAIDAYLRPFGPGYDRSELASERNRNNLLPGLAFYSRLLALFLAGAYLSDGFIPGSRNRHLMPPPLIHSLTSCLPHSFQMSHARGLVKIYDPPTYYVCLAFFGLSSWLKTKTIRWGAPGRPALYILRGLVRLSPGALVLAFFGFGPGSSRGKIWPELPFPYSGWIE